MFDYKNSDSFTRALITHNSYLIIKPPNARLHDGYHDRIE